MILSIFALWLAAAFGFSFYGWYTKTDLYRFFGAGLFVILGFITSPAMSTSFGHLEYQSGHTETIVGNVTTIVYTYSTFSSHVIGLYLAILGAFSFYIIYMDRREIDAER